MCSVCSVRGGRSSVGRVPDCDSGRRGFESHRSPHFFRPGSYQKLNAFRGVPVVGGRFLEKAKGGQGDISTL